MLSHSNCSTPSFNPAVLSERSPTNFVGYGTSARPSPQIVNHADGSGAHTFRKSGTAFIVAAALSASGSALSAAELGFSKLLAERLTAASPSWNTAHFAALNELSEYQELHDGWDGPGSIKPKPGTIEIAKVFLKLIPSHARSPEPTVSADGAVEWFWKTGTDFISVHFPEGRTFGYYATVKGLEVRGRYAAFGDKIPDDLMIAIESI